VIANAGCIMIGRLTKKLARKVTDSWGRPSNKCQCLASDWDENFQKNKYCILHKLILYDTVMEAKENTVSI